MKYRYYKRSEERDSDAWMILRESLHNPFELERWEVDRWESAIDSWWQTRQECDYWDITEDEALSELEDLGRRQSAAMAKREREDAAARENRERDDAAAREKILLERQQSWGERANADSWTALEHSAIVLHELFKTCVEVGFTEEQALTLISKLLLGDKGSPGRTDVRG